jgi:hypothetical protein
VDDDELAGEVFFRDQGWFGSATSEELEAEAKRRNVAILRMVYDPDMGAICEAILPDGDRVYGTST